MRPWWRLRLDIRIAAIALAAGPMAAPAWSQSGRNPARAGRPVAPQIAEPVGTPIRGVSTRSTSDPALRRVQDVAAPPLPDASAPLTAPVDLGVPAADRPIGGGEPTIETAATEAAEAPAADEPIKVWDQIGFEELPFKIYGWSQNSYTQNLNGYGNGINAGVTPNFKANNWMGNQLAYIIMEDPLELDDTINFGWRVDNLFGHDWAFNYEQGFLNEAFNLGELGYDLAQVYGEVHLPWFTEGGLDIKGGRFYTLAGYEQVPAIARPLLSVPYMFVFGQPFTHVGALTTLHLTDKINLYNGAINGWDRWFNENYKWGYIGGFSWTGNEDRTTFAFTAVWGPNQFPRQLPASQQIYPTGYINIPQLAGLPNPGYGANDRTLFTSVLTHKWSDKLTQVLETDQGWERNVPGLASGGRNGAAKSQQWFSFGNWFLYQMTPKLTAVWRSEVFWDMQGGRTSMVALVGGQPEFAGDRFYEMTLGLIYKPCPNLWIRPECRFDWTQYHPYFDGGTRDSQTTLAVDAILLF